MIILKNANKAHVNKIISTLEKKGISLGAYHPDQCYFIVLDKRMVALSVRALSMMSYDSNEAANCNSALKEHLEESIDEGDFKMGGVESIGRDILYNSWQLHYYAYSKKVEINAKASPVIKQMCNEMGVQYIEASVTVQLVQFSEFNALELAVKDYCITTIDDDEKLLALDILYLLARAKSYQGSDAPYELFNYLTDAIETRSINMDLFKSEMISCLSEFNIEKWGSTFVDDLTCIVKGGRGNGGRMLKQIHAMFYPQDVYINGGTLTRLKILLKKD